MDGTRGGAGAGTIRRFHMRWEGAIPALEMVMRTAGGDITLGRIGSVCHSLAETHCVPCSGFGDWRADIKYRWITDGNEHPAASYVW